MCPYMVIYCTRTSVLYDPRLREGTGRLLPYATSWQVGENLDFYTFSHQNSYSSLLAMDVHPCSSPVIPHTDDRWWPCVEPSKKSKNRDFASDAPWSTGTLQPSGPGGFAWTPGWNDQGTKGSNRHWSKRPTMAHASWIDHEYLMWSARSWKACPFYPNQSSDIAIYCNFISNTPGLVLIFSPIEITKLQVGMFAIVCCWWDPRMLSPTR